MAAKRVFTVDGWTPVNVADTTGFTAAGYAAIGALSATTGLLINEIRLSGLAVASTVNRMVFARDSTIAVGPSALVSPNTDGPLTSIGQAPIQISFVTVATTQPQRASGITAARLALSFNSFGGIHVEQFPPGGEWGIVGVTASVSESSLTTNQASPGLMSSSIHYEPM
jgi:hypothetical protein